MSELVQIVTNTTPPTTTLISLSSTNPEFSINFPTPIGAKEMALIQLRVYNSWPNIRSKSFGKLLSNNSLVVADKKHADGTPSWFVVSIPTGSYEIEQINSEFNTRISNITGDAHPGIKISAHEPTLSSIIEVSSPYMVDIYRSSIRTVLGWPDIPPGRITTPEPKKSDFISNEKNFHGLDLDYIDQYEQTKASLDFSSGSVYMLDLFEDSITILFVKIINEYEIQKKLLEHYFQDCVFNVQASCNEIIITTERINKLAADMELINELATGYIQNSAVFGMGFIINAFMQRHNLTERTLPNYKFPGYNVDEMRKFVADTVDRLFPKLHDAWVKKKTQAESILMHDNDGIGQGRHISPGIVNITEVIAVYLHADVVEGSYNVDPAISKAEQGFILYTFSPNVSPGYLIIKEPVNPFYLRCHNRLLSRINFKLTNQDGNLLDIRRETLSISLLVRS